MEWPYRRFVKAFSAFQRRDLINDWKQRRATHIAALWSNTNWDDEKNDRQSAIDRLERSYEDLIARIWNSDGKPTEQEAEEEKAWDSPFMKASRKQVAAQMAGIQSPRLPGESAISALPA